MTQPDIYIGFTPSLDAGHGNHQQAGRYIWEGVKAAADPDDVPGAADGPERAQHLAGQEGLLRRQHRRHRRHDRPPPTAPPASRRAATNLDTVAGVWTGYDSPYLWPAGNVQGQPAGTPRSGRRSPPRARAAYPTQSRVMIKAHVDPGLLALRHDRLLRAVPAERQPGRHGQPAAGKDDAILYGAIEAGPGRAAAGHARVPHVLALLQHAGRAVRRHAEPEGRRRRAGRGHRGADVPAGWTADAPPSRPWARSPRGDVDTVQFTVTPAADAAVDKMYKIAAPLHDRGPRRATRMTLVRLVSPAEGRFQRFGKWAEYDNWLENTAPGGAPARPLGRARRRSAWARRSTSRSSSTTGPTRAQSGTVTPRRCRPTSPPTRRRKPYGPLAPGADATVNVHRHEHATRTRRSRRRRHETRRRRNVTIAITTTLAPAGTGCETLTMSIVPKTTIPAAASAPTLDGVEGAGEYAGEPLDIGRMLGGRQQPQLQPPAAPTAAPPAAPGRPTAPTPRSTRDGDDLYFFIHVRDDFQSYAVTPAECVAHWLADSVEILIDPRGRASADAMDTANTFKLGIFPFTNDPANTNGNGANGPCWSRDADNHQGFSTGPLAATVDDAPNAPGVQVASTATWVGTNDTRYDHALRAAAATRSRSRSRWPLLPAAVDPDKHGPEHHALRQRHNTAAAGSTTLRHIDNSARLAWSTFGSVQSDPYRWGRATLPGYTPPAGRPTTAPDAERVATRTSTARLAADDRPVGPQRRADLRPRAGAREPPASRVNGAGLEAATVELNLDAGGAGHRPGVPVRPATEQELHAGVEHELRPGDGPGAGLRALRLRAADGTTPPWSPDMSGRVVATREDIALGNGRHADHAAA